MRPSESVIAANVPLGDKVSFSPFLGWSIKLVRDEAALNHEEKSQIIGFEFRNGATIMENISSTFSLW